jgi:hypothetical protein
MRKVFGALRLTFDQDRSQREIGTILSLSQSTVHDYVVRFRATGLPWPLSVEIDEAVLETRLFTRSALPPLATRPVPDWATVHQELKRGAGALPFSLREDEFELRGGRGPQARPTPPTLRGRGLWRARVVGLPWRRLPAA